MKLYKYLLLITPLLAIQSCSKELGEDPKAPVGLEPRIAGVSLITRGGASGAADIRTLGIYAVNKKDGETTYGVSPIGTYCKYKLESGNASPDGDAETLWLNQEQATIFSYHPIVNGVSVTAGGNATTPVPTITIQALAITPAQTIATAKDNNIYDFASPANDYMYGVEYDSNQSSEAKKYLSTQPIADNGHQLGDVTPKGREVAIGLKHAFAQVSFIVKRGDTYQGAAKVTKVTHTRNMPTLKADNTTTMNLTDGALKNLADATEITYSYTFNNGVAPTLSTISGGITLTNYVIPYSTTSDQSKLVVTVDGKDMTLLPYTDPAWEAGNIYTYTIIINPTGLTLDGFNITGWNDESLPDVNV